MCHTKYLVLLRLLLPEDMSIWGSEVQQVGFLVHLLVWDVFAPVDQGQDHISQGR